MDNLTKQFGFVKLYMSIAARRIWCGTLDLRLPNLDRSIEVEGLYPIDDLYFNSGMGYI